MPLASSTGLCERAAAARVRAAPRTARLPHSAHVRVRAYVLDAFERRKALDLWHREELLRHGTTATLQEPKVRPSAGVDATAA